MIHEKSNDTKVIESVLAEAKVGDLITYEEISKAIGRDVRLFAMPSLGSARRILLNERKFVFGVEKNIGYRRLNDSEIVDASVSDRQKIKRAANRSIKKLSVVAFEVLTGEQKRQHTAASAQFGAIAMFASKSATKKILTKVNDTKEVLAIGETLKMFS